MKTLLSTATLLLLIHFNSFSQNISIADFLQLRGKNSNAIEEKLSAFNIQLYDTDEMGSGKTQYTYQNENSSSAATPLQWVDFVYAQDAQWNNRLSIQIQDIEQVKKYLSEMKDLGFYFTGKKVMDRQIYEVYTDGKSTIELITSQSRKVYDNNMYFNFAFYSTDEYQYAFANENKKYTVPQINQSELFADLVGISMTAQK
ncbi:MAG: hypothetical protein U0X41_07605 [Chitinophagales bacterium]